MAFRKQVKSLAASLLDWGWDYNNKKPHTTFNPTRTTIETGKVTPIYTLFHYNENELREEQLPEGEACTIKKHGDVVWLNIDGLKKDEVERIAATYGIHPFVVEDILSAGQRAKMDEIGDVIYCLLPMIYYNEGTGYVETEQVSIILGKHFVLSFQEDQTRDVFNPVREKLRIAGSKLRLSSADYLCYSLIEIIVD